MNTSIAVKREISVGVPTFIESPSGSNAFVVVFEDDGRTGYFYALDMGEERIVDAMQIYDVVEITDRELPSVVEIAWSSDALKAALFVNEYPHAVFDFSDKRRYCRTGYPPAESNWSAHSHDWDDAAMELLK
jgi:hypothetical protein